MDFFETDFSAVKLENNFEPVPVGTYTVVSDNAELKDTKDGLGNYILIKFKILDSDKEGRFLFSNFNTKNKNEQAVSIDIQKLKGFIDASGIKQNKFKSPVELVGFKAQAVVKHKTDAYGTKAVISYFKPVTKDVAAKEVKASKPGKSADGLW